MKIANYGVTLSRLTEDKIELVRNWRNDPKIAQFMEFNEYITPEMQLKWFNKINNDKNYYFIIEYNGLEIGLINIRDLDFDKMEGEAGIFIYNDEYLNSDISFRSNLLLCEFCFETLHLHRIIAHILKDNKRAIQYNLFFGYKIAANQTDVLNQLYYLKEVDFITKKDKLIRLF